MHHVTIRWVIVEIGKYFNRIIMYFVLLGIWCRIIIILFLFFLASTIFSFIIDSVPIIVFIVCKAWNSSSSVYLLFILNILNIKKKKINEQVWIYGFFFFYKQMLHMFSLCIITRFNKFSSLEWKALYCVNDDYIYVKMTWSSKKKIIPWYKDSLIRLYYKSHLD
jgi:hypothetical protein